MHYRVEHDSLGTKKIPDLKYYGIQTQRAIENFRITGITMAERPKLVYALAAIKQAAAMANKEQGLLKPAIANAIIKACKEIYAGAYLDQFPVDMIQGGAGTSANMCANEVICNRALEIMGHKKGEYQYIHVNNHVNLSQSTNDVYPTATKIALIWMSADLIEGIESLRDAFLVKAKEFKNIIKMGRTQLQDAVPMTLGQEFKAFAATIDQDIGHLKEILNLCREINMGATAIGTGINTVPGYGELVCKHLSTITGLKLSEASDLIAATSDTGVYVSLSSVLKRFAVKLTKICNDLRLISSGPKAGFHDINLPAAQPGSSIMPGKVNPVIPEVVNQICFQIMGFDLAVTMAAAAGQMQLNAFEPLMVHDLFESMTMLRRGCNVLRERCVDGIVANAEHTREVVMSSPGILTAFCPYIGYEAAAEIAKKVEKSDKTVYELIKDTGLLSDKEIAEILSPDVMTSPHKQYHIAKKLNNK
jgi:aspartate ammonia-lyase